MLNAIEAYTEHRPEITSRAINLLFDIARIERCNQLLRALKVSSDPEPSGSQTALPSFSVPLHPLLIPGDDLACFLPFGSAWLSCQLVQALP